MTYQTVDITGMRDAAFIKERIFTKLCIPDDEDRAQFSIYLTQISKYAIGGALTDDELFSICRDRGDADGSLKFFVAHSSASVHENVAQTIINTIPPPVLPPSVAVHYPSRPSRRPRSPNHSVSSVSESQAHDIPPGYVADVDNNVDRDRNRPRPLPKPSHQGPSSPKDAHPSSEYSPSSHTSASFIPSRGNAIPANMRTQSHVGAPHSPTRHSQDEQPTSTHSHLRTASENETRLVQNHGLKRDRIREKQTKNTDEDRDWVNVGRAHDLRAQESGKSPSSAMNRRHSPGYKRPLAIPNPPRIPPPAVPEPRLPPPRGNAVPPNWMVTYKPPVGKTDVVVPTPPTFKGYTEKKDMSKAKSMDNLNQRAGMSHPSLLQPGGRRQPVLPVAPGEVRREMSGGSHMGPKSYDGRGRPYPMLTSPYGTNIDYSPQSVPQSNSTLISPSSSDLHARPRSALDSPIHGGSQRVPRLQSPHQDSYDTETSRTTLPWSTSGYTSVGTLLPTGKSGQQPDSTRLPIRSPASPRFPADQSDSDLLDYDLNNGSGTLMPGRQLDSGSSTAMSSSTFSGSIYSTSTGTSMGGFWKVLPERPKSILKPPLTVDVPDWQQQQQQRHPTFDLPRDNPRQPSSSTLRHPRPKQDREPRPISKFKDERPLPEDVYDNLEEYFPHHDLDKPLEATSGGTSPTVGDVGPPATVAAAAPRPPPTTGASDLSRVKGKKSIRIVAEEHKQKYRESRADPRVTGNLSRKRNTKLWGSKPEEIKAADDKTVIPPLPVPDSPVESTKQPKASFKWVRGEMIGQGSFGKVYLAMNASTGEMMAVKQVEIIRTASDKQSQMVEALHSESETLKDLDHPNIVQYLGFEETPHNLSIFLEYVPGGSVGSCLLKYGKFDEEVTKSFTAQILAGLEYLHSRGIMHRDMKADNVLVETSGICKISDFGISKKTSEIGGAFTAMKGTVFWMAPEVIYPKEFGYNFKIDIWSVGCVLLEMWAGSRPWTGEESVAVMFKLYQAQQPPPIPDGVVLSPTAEDFRLKCFAINPDERPSASELRQHPYLTLQPGWIFTGFK
jgi:hypothetical protein